MDFKQVIVVRRDVNMGTGKIAAQVAHAAVMSAEKARARKREWFDSWFKGGQAKVVVKVKSIEELMEIRKRAEELCLPVVASLLQYLERQLLIRQVLRQQSLYQK